MKRKINSKKLEKDFKYFVEEIFQRMDFTSYKQLKNPNDYKTWCLNDDDVISIFYQTKMTSSILFY